MIPPTFAGLAISLVSVDTLTCVAVLLVDTDGLLVAVVLLSIALL